MRVHTPPVVSPLSLTAVRQYLRVTTDDEAALLADLIIPAASERFEGDTSRALAKTTYEHEWTFEPYVELPALLVLLRTPATAIDQVTYAVDDEDPEVVDSGLYELVATNEPSRVLLFDRDRWPDDESVRWHRSKRRRVTVRWTAGHEPVQVATLADEEFGGDVTDFSFVRDASPRFVVGERLRVAQGDDAEVLTVESQGANGVYTMRRGANPLHFDGGESVYAGAAIPKASALPLLLLVSLYFEQRDTIIETAPGSTLVEIPGLLADTLDAQALL